MITTIITQRLGDGCSLTQTSDSEVYQLKLDEQKSYRVIKVSDTEVKVSRDSEYQVSSDKLL